MVTILSFSELDVLDMILEGLTLVAYIFVFIMILYAKKKNQIFGAKPFPLLMGAVGMGLFSGLMDFSSEFIWFDKSAHYDIYKSIMQILKITSLVIFAIAMLLLFRFQKFLMGEDEI
jgi:hypothetical protein